MSVLEKHTWQDASSTAGGLLSLPTQAPRGKASLASSGLLISWHLQDLMEADYDALQARKLQKQGSYVVPAKVFSELSTKYVLENNL